jgi:hypothetical protein
MSVCCISPDFSPGGAAGLQLIDGLEEVAIEQISACFQMMPIPALAGSRAPASGIPARYPG